jgi:hypothetical protein
MIDRHGWSLGRRLYLAEKLVMRASRIPTAIDPLPVAKGGFAALKSNDRSCDTIARTVRRK